MSKITIRDIAIRAGVSTATVSRVLNKTGPISTETEARVLAAAAELKFRLPAARRKHLNLGMIIAGVDTPSPQTSFFNEIVNGASTFANSIEATFSVAPLSFESDEYPVLLRRGGLDGLIVAGVPLREEVVENLNSLPIPVVFIGRYLEPGKPLNYVAPDNIGGGMMAARHLFELGHRHVAVLNGPIEINTFFDRLQGVQQVLGSGSSTWIRLHKHFDEDAGYEAARSILAEHERPTAILALSDWMAIGALRAVNERGLNVPKDVSLIGFSDLPVMELLDPPLSTIRIPQRKLGAVAVNFLNSLIQREINAPLGMVVPVELVVRRSTTVVNQLMNTAEQIDFIPVVKESI